MVLYLFLFVSALGGKKRGASKAGSMSRPLLNEKTGSAAGDGESTHGHSIDNQDYVPMDYHDSDHYSNSTATRGKSFSEIVENITNRLSISIRAEEFNEGNDEMAPLRTMSVA